MHLPIEPILEHLKSEKIQWFHALDSYQEYHLCQNYDLLLLNALAYHLDIDRLHLGKSFTDEILNFAVVKGWFLTVCYLQSRGERKTTEEIETNRVNVTT